MIVCLEGLDGSGKSTQARLLAERLGARLFKFPNKESPTGQLIYAHLDQQWRTLVGDPKPWTQGDVERRRLDPTVFQALQLANRMEVATEVFEAAARGNVVFDRYWPSGYAYGVADGLPGDYLIQLHRWLPQPDLFVLLDVEPETSLRRREMRRDRYEMNLEHQTQVVANYRELWTRESIDASLRWVRVNGMSPVDVVAGDVAAAVAELREAQLR